MWTTCSEPTCERDRLSRSIAGISRYNDALNYKSIGYFIRPSCSVGWVRLPFHAAPYAAPQRRRAWPPAEHVTSKVSLVVLGILEPVLEACGSFAAGHGCTLVGPKPPVVLLVQRVGASHVRGGFRYARTRPITLFATKPADNVIKKAFQSSREIQLDPAGQTARLIDIYRLAPA